jgi:hypothetical protein
MMQRYGHCHHKAQRAFFCNSGHGALLLLLLSPMKTPTRVLTIEDFNPKGRLSQTSVASLIRLKGCWLKQAGFHASAQVAVHNLSPGVIELRVSSPVPIDASFTTAIEQLNAVLNENTLPT